MIGPTALAGQRPPAHPEFPAMRPGALGQLESRRWAANRIGALVAP